MEITIGCDRFANHASLRVLVDEVVKRAPNVVGLSLYLWNINASMALARAIKTRMPNTRIVIGGPEVTPESRDLLNDPVFDAAVFGEGEVPFVALLDGWLRRDLSTAPPGSACRINHVLELGPPNRQLIDLSLLASPILSGDIDLDQFDDIFLFTMRGCVQGCAYCAWRGRGRLRPFPIEQLQAEIRMLHDHALRNCRKRRVFIEDSAFNTSPVFEPLCHAIAAINIDKMLEFHCFLLAERLTDRMGTLLKHANITSVEIGLQSANADALRKVCRPVDLDAFLNGVQVLRKYAIPVVADAIIGLPGDNFQGFFKTMDFLESHGLHGLYFNLSLPMGVSLRKTAEKMGLKYSDDPPYYVYVLIDYAIYYCLNSSFKRLIGRGFRE